jgi:hypothetical protein
MDAAARAGKDRLAAEVAETGTPGAAPGRSIRRFAGARPVCPPGVRRGRAATETAEERIRRASCSGPFLNEEA